jgi:CRISPR-associated protein Cmr2
MTHNPSDIVLFTFGPIQTFIAASRRTQDLAVSSLILSSLAKAGLTYIENDSNLELVFPIKTGGAWAKRLPNRIVFVAPEGEGKNFAEQVVGKITQNWLTIADGVKDYLLPKVTHKGWVGQWDAQVSDWLETYWVSVSWDGDDSTYNEAFQKLNLGIDSRKHLRFYPSTPQPGAKCTLSGIRSAIGVNGGNIWNQIRSRVSPAELRETEQLSAISAIKRFADKANIPGINLDRFPSTSSMAVASFKNQLLDHWQDVQADVENFFNTINALGLMIFQSPEPFPLLVEKAGRDQLKQSVLRIEGDYFYKEFFVLEKINASRSPHLEDLRPGRETNEKIKNAQSALSVLLDKMSEISKNERVDAPFPNRYYAAIMMDGDHMGKLIDNAASLEAHQQMSRTLAETADEIQVIVEEAFPGKLIYSSGDDALALAPVNCALEIARRIREAFKTNMAPFDPDADMSGGIAVMHHQSPLEAILTKARQAEHKAKEVYERKSLVTVVSKRSGEELDAAMKWQDPGTVNPITSLTEYLSMGWISSKFIYDLRNEESAFHGNLRVFELELPRLLKRHSDGDNPNLNIDSLVQRLLAFNNCMPSQSLSQLINWLMVARFLAQGERS